MEFESVGPAPPPVPKCVFCGKPIREKQRWVLHVQVVYDGLSEDGRFIRKRPGARILWHAVCELPEELEGAVGAKSPRAPSEPPPGVGGTMKAPQDPSRPPG